jgi:hypothetical protein
MAKKTTNSGKVETKEPVMTRVVSSGSDRAC